MFTFFVLSGQHWNRVNSRFASLSELLGFVSRVLPLVATPAAFCACLTSVEEALVGSAFAWSCFSGVALVRAGSDGGCGLRSDGLPMDGTELEVPTYRLLLAVISSAAGWEGHLNIRAHLGHLVVLRLALSPPRFLGQKVHRLVLKLSHQGEVALHWFSAQSQCPPSWLWCLRDRSGGCRVRRT